MCCHAGSLKDLTSRVSCSSVDSDSWNEETFADDCDTATNGHSEGHANAPLVNVVKGPPKDGESSMKQQRSKKASPKKPKAEAASDLTWFQAFCLLLEWLKLNQCNEFHSSLAGFSSVEPRWSLGAGHENCTPRLAKGSCYEDRSIRCLDWTKTKIARKSKQPKTKNISRMVEDIS